MDDFSQQPSQPLFTPNPGQEVKGTRLKDEPVGGIHHSPLSALIKHHILEDGEGSLAKGKIKRRVVCNDHEISGETLGRAGPKDVALSGLER